jgi:hypothetical protein
LFSRRHCEFVMKRKAGTKQNEDPRQFDLFASRSVRHRSDHVHEASSCSDAEILQRIAAAVKARWTEEISRRS